MLCLSNMIELIASMMKYNWIGAISGGRLLKVLGVGSDSCNWCINANSWPKLM